MKFLFILLIPFLVSINSVSDEKNARVKDCSIEVTEKAEYLEGGYKLDKKYRIDMKYRYNGIDEIPKRRDVTDFAMIGKKGQHFKLITQFRYDNLDNLVITIKDFRRNVIESQTILLDKKIVELRTILPYKGIYYMSFVRKDTLNENQICAAAYSYIKK